MGAILYYLCVGHSHIYAVKFCYEIGGARRAYDDIDLQFVELQEVVSAENYGASSDGMCDSLRNAFEAVEIKRGGPPAAVFFSVGGSHQHNISMLNHEKPVDVIVPWRPDAPITKGATLIPFRMMERLLIERSAWKLKLLGLMADYFSCPKYFFQAPPPIASEEHIRQYPGPVFQPLIQEHGISPLSFRQKISEMHTNMYKNQCEKHDVTFLYAPLEGLDENGFLDLPAAAPDSIHASEVYGGHLINQIRRLRSASSEVQI